MLPKQMTLFDLTILAIFAVAIFEVIRYLWVPLLPRKVRVFNEQCKRRFLTIFTGWTRLDEAVQIPNGLIVGSYLFCCVMAIGLLP
jgi:hypothetical protein